MWIFILVAAILLVIFPLFRQGFFVTDDGEWMIIRLSSFFQTLRDGQFPVRFLGRLNHGFGYPVANFLYPGFLYIGSFFHVLGFSFIGAVKVLLAGSVVLAGFFTYKWLRTFFSVLASVIGSLFFILSPYLVFDIYTRGSVGEVLAISAISLCLWTIEARRKTIFTFVFALLLVSHNSLALLFTAFLVAYLLVRRRHDLWISSLLSIGMTMFFWFPAISEARFIQFDAVKVSDPSHYFNQSMSLALGGFGVFGIILVLFWSKLKHTSLSIYMLIVAIMSLFFATKGSSFFWSGQIATLFQFPYRFIPLATVVSAWILSAVADVSKKKTQIALVAGTLVYLSASVVPMLKDIHYVDRPLTYYTTNEGTTTVANEYMARWAQIFPTNRPLSPLVLYSGQGSVDIQQYNTQKIVAHITTTEKSVVQQNTVYYPGWGVTINNQPADISHENELGVIRVNLPPGAYTYNSEFRETVPRFIADAVSLVSFVGLGVYSFIKRKK